MSVQVTYKNQIMFFLILFIIVIISVEFGARVFEFIYPYCMFPHTDAFKEVDWFDSRWICFDSMAVEWVEDPILLYSPNQSFSTIHINNVGFRGPDISIEKPMETYRIFVVGGSTTFGYGSSNDDTTIPGYIQKEFKNFKNIEVINAGIGLATSFEEKYLIQNIITDLSPDMIIVYDGWNDGVYRKINGMVPLGIVDTDKDPFKFKNYPFYRTPFVISANIINNDVQAESDIRTQKEIVTPEIKKTVTDLWKQNIEQICKTQEKKGIKTMVFLQPLVSTGNKPLFGDESTFNNPELHDFEDTSEIVLMLSGQLDNLKNTCSVAVNLTNVFDNTKKPVFYDQGHMNELGNKIIAKKIYDNIYPIVLEEISK